VRPVVATAEVAVVAAVESAAVSAVDFFHWPLSVV
jgi:hypothetical protein